jgi:hypothetical protein
MRIELQYDSRGEGSWLECGLCRDDFTASAVQGFTRYLPGEYVLRPVCLRCVKLGNEGLRNCLQARASELRWVADQLEQAAEGTMHIPALEDIHEVERLKASGFYLDGVFPKDGEGW